MDEKAITSHASLPSFVSYPSPFCQSTVAFACTNSLILLCCNTVYIQYSVDRARPSSSALSSSSPVCLHCAAPLMRNAKNLSRMTKLTGCSTPMSINHLTQAPMEPQKEAKEAKAKKEAARSGQCRHANNCTMLDKPTSWRVNLLTLRRNDEFSFHHMSLARGERHIPQHFEIFTHTRHARKSECAMLQALCKGCSSFSDEAFCRPPTCYPTDRDQYGSFFFFLTFSAYHLFSSRVSSRDLFFYLAAR